MNTQKETESGEVVQVTLEHAQLIIKEETPTKLILETNPSRPNTAYRRETSLALNIIIASIASGLIVFALPSFSKMNMFVVGLLFIVLVFVIFVLLMYLSQKILDLFQKSRDGHHITTITIEADHNRVNYTKSSKGSVSDKRELSFDQVDKVTLFSVDYSPMPERQWPSVIAFNLTDNSNFIINSGHREEMKFIANKIVSLIEKSLEEKYVGSPKELPR
jgi:hypothetical protein